MNATTGRLASSAILVRTLAVLRAGGVVLLAVFFALQLAVLGVVFVIAIVSSFDDLKYASVWKDRSAIALSDGYRDYQGEINLTDYGVVVFSYAYRSGSAPLIQLRNRIVKEHPCYMVIGESPTRLTLRCGDASQRYNGAYEYDFLLDPARGRVFVLRMSHVPRSEERYRELVGALDDALRWHKPSDSSS